MEGPSLVDSVVDLTHCKSGGLCPTHSGHGKKTEHGIVLFRPSFPQPFGLEVARLLRETEEFRTGDYLLDVIGGHGDDLLLLLRLYVIHALCRGDVNPSLVGCIGQRSLEPGERLPGFVGISPLAVDLYHDCLALEPCKLLQRNPSYTSAPHE